MKPQTHTCINLFVHTSVCVKYTGVKKTGVKYVGVNNKIQTVCNRKVCTKDALQVMGGGEREMAVNGEKWQQATHGNTKTGLAK